MYLPEVYEDFVDYLKPGDSPWIERGLVENAPESAVRAYKKFVKMEKENKKKGIIA